MKPSGQKSPRCKVRSTRDSRARFGDRSERNAQRQSPGQEVETPHHAVWRRAGECPHWSHRYPNYGWRRRHICHYRFQGLAAGPLGPQTGEPSSMTRSARAGCIARHPHHTAGETLAAITGPPAPYNTATHGPAAAAAPRNITTDGDGTPPDPSATEVGEPVRRRDEDDHSSGDVGPFRARWSRPCRVVLMVSAHASRDITAHNG